MIVIVMTCICAAGIISTCLICIRLLSMFKKTNFINKFYTVLFCFNCVSSLTVGSILLLIGQHNFSEDIEPSTTPSPYLRSLCSGFLFASHGSNDVIINGNIAILFTRFVYVKHALGLVQEGIDLFHNLVVLTSIFFLVFFFLGYPLHGFIRYYDHYPLNMIKVVH